MANPFSSSGSGRSPLRLFMPTACLLGLLFVVVQLFRRDVIPRPRLHVSSGSGSSSSSSSSGIMSHLSSFSQPLVDPDEMHGPSKTIVMAALSHENTSWVAAELPGWDRAIYVVDAAEAGLAVDDALLRVPRNKGNEANAYLWYILQHYDRLPDVMVFLHSHRDGKGRAWHVDNPEHSNVLSLDRLRLDSVLAQGYLNLRCIQIPGCPDGVRPTYDATDLPAEPKVANHLPAALRAMFPRGFPRPLDADSSPSTPSRGATPYYYPDLIAAPCCAQFAVSRAQVRARPRADYQRYHDWLMATDLKNYDSGRVMEYTWHIIFGRDPYYCPKQSDCGCRNYGAGCKG